MTKKAYEFWPSPDKEINKKCLPLLERLEENGQTVVVVNDALILEGKVNLPCLQTPNEMRYFKKESIQKYIERNYSNN